MKNIDTEIESLLFLSPKPLKMTELAKMVGVSDEDVSHALQRLEVVYNTGQRGIRLTTHEGKVRMTTAPESADVVAAFVEDEVRGPLTRPQLETLTVIAYRGPIAKTDLEHVRGVNCSLILRNLSMRGLIESKEDLIRLQTVYSVSMDFLQTLGLENIDQLPEYATLHTADVIDRLLEQHNEISNSPNSPNS